MERRLDIKKSQIIDNNEIGYFNDTVLIAKIDGKNRILTLTGKVEKGDKNNYLGFCVALDLQGNKYLLEWDLAIYNSFKHRAYFDYYYNEQKLEFAREKTDLMNQLKIKEGDKISYPKLAKFENLLNNKTVYEDIIL